MSFAHPMVKLKELLTPIEREELSKAGVIYRQIGVKLWGKGAYERDAVSGDETKYKKFNQIKSDDVVINKIWARHGSVCIIPKELEGCYVSAEFPIFVINKKKLSSRWLQIITQMKFFWSECDKYSSGTSGKNRIKPGMFLEIEIPLPTIEEQEKLVEVIDKYSDQLFVISDHREKTLKHYYHLKRSILHDAVQGKLVPQDPNDEPASVLLEKIKAEKEHLIKDKKIRKDKPLPEITVDEIPYELPQGWDWVRLGNVSFVTKLAGFEYTNDITPNLKSKGEVALIKGKNINNSKLNFNFEHYIDEELSIKLDRSSVTKKCLLTPFVGSIGNIAIIDPEKRYHLAANVAKIEPYNPNEELLLVKYLLFYFQSPLGNAELIKHSKSTAQINISMEAIRDSFIPIPSTNEQKRIIVKVDQLMGLCDELEKSVQQSKQDSEMLMKTILQRVFQQT
jgi:type I restriction enzyme S subunit